MNKDIDFLDTKIKRGDIYFADLNPVVGSEQGDERPVLVVQNNIGNEHSPTIVVAPLTGNLRKNPLPTHVFIPKCHRLDKDSIALIEQIRTIDRSRISDFIGKLSDRLIPALDKALAICVGIEKRRTHKGDVLFLSLCRSCESSFRSSGYLLVKKGWQEVKDNCDFAIRTEV